MAREKKFASPSGEKEAPAGIRPCRPSPWGAVRFLPKEEWLDSFVKDSEVCELIINLSKRYATTQVRNK
jgi:hypothetical protein